MYKVVTTHADAEPIINSKEIFEAAVALYTSECKIAAGHLSNKPGYAVSVQLINPDGSPNRHMSITSHCV